MPDKEQLAAEARNLRENEAFQMALTSLRAHALEALVVAQATDTESIRNMQAQVRVIDRFRDEIEGIIAAGQPRKTPGIA